MTEVKKALDSQIIAGESLCYAVSEHIKLMNEALDKLSIAQKDTNSKIGFEAVQHVDLARIRSKIYKSMAAAQDVEAEHKRLSEDYCKLGYPKLTSSDFCGAVPEFQTRDTRR